MSVSKLVQSTVQTRLVNPTSITVKRSTPRTPSSSIKGFNIPCIPICLPSRHLPPHQPLPRYVSLYPLPLPSPPPLLMFNVPYSITLILVETHMKKRIFNLATGIHRFEHRKNKIKQIRIGSTPLHSINSISFSSSHT